MLTGKSDKGGVEESERRLARSEVKRKRKSKETARLRAAGVTTSDR